MSPSGRVDNKGKFILILGEGPTQGLDDNTLTAEAKYPTNFAQSGKSISIQRKKLRNKRLCAVFR